MKLLEIALAVKEGKMSLKAVPKGLQKHVRNIITNLSAIGEEALKGERRSSPRQRANRPNFR